MDHFATHPASDQFTDRLAQALQAMNMRVVHHTNVAVWVDRDRYPNRAHVGHYRCSTSDDPLDLLSMDPHPTLVRIEVAYGLYRQPRTLERQLDLPHGFVRELEDQCTGHRFELVAHQNELHDLALWVAKVIMSWGGLQAPQVHPCVGWLAGVDGPTTDPSKATCGWTRLASDTVA